MSHHHHPTTHGSQWRIPALLALLATACLLLVSPDSYLHDLFNRVDSAWFYMCGKAWMEGMTPYVDFTDSKGPLLWLIYGAGYLISRHDYTGVFWLSCMSYALTLWLIYRSALLLTGNRRWALLCATLMPLAYFYPYIHEEIKTEDFAQPFIALCLYSTTLLTQASRLTTAAVRRSLAAIGLSIACLLMMKYSLAGMTAIFALLALPAAKRQGLSPSKAIMWGLAGFAIALLPWAAYFALAGNFTAFVQEYFINTFDTLHHLRHQNGTIIDILLKLRHHHIVTLFPLLCAGGAIVHALVFKRQRWVAITATAWFFIGTVPNAWWIYYYNSCTWTLYFGITAVAVLCSRRMSAPPRSAIATAAIAVTAATGAWSIAITPQNFFTSHNKARDTYYRYAYLMQQVEQPKVIYWDIYSTGFETAAGGLPGCKYWAGQNGATPAMQRAQEQAVKNGEADFVLVADTTHHAQLTAWGYNVWDYNYRNNTGRCDDLLYTLYTRHRLKAPPPGFAPPTPHEIITKRWHLQ